MKNLLKISAAIATFLIISTSQPAMALYTPFSDICKGRPDPKPVACQEAGKAAKDKNPIYGPNSIMLKATSLVAFIVGIASVIMIIIAGIKFITSQGDPNNVSSARNTVLYALIGLAIAASAQLIVTFVANRLLTG